MEDVVSIHRNNIMLLCMEYILKLNGYVCISEANAKDRLQTCGLNSHDASLCMHCGLALQNTHH